MKYLYLQKLLILGITLFTDITYNIAYSLCNIDKIKKFSFLSKIIYSYKNNNIINIDSNTPTKNNWIINKNEFLMKNDTIIYDIFYNEKNNMNCIILINHKNKEIFTVFKGTSTFTDWFYNFDILPVPIAKCNLFSVHSGVYKLYHSNNFNNNIINSLININKKYKPYKNYICGHSRGGVHSQLLSFELNNKITNLNIEVYTFGSPFLLNKSFANYLTNNKKIIIYNIINEYDPIPYVKFYYAEPFGNILILKDNSLLSNIKFNQNKQSNLILLYNSIININKYINNHNISSYYTNIMNLEKSNF
jgi:predicted lipase